jgi:hypothetical protein
MTPFVNVAYFQPGGRARVSKPTYTELRDALNAAIRSIELMQATASPEAVASVQARLERFKDVYEASGRLRKRYKKGGPSPVTPPA